MALAGEVVKLCEQPSTLRFAYALDQSIEEKIGAICKRILHADGAVLLPAAKTQAEKLTELGFGALPICMAKTQLPFRTTRKARRTGGLHGHGTPAQGLRRRGLHRRLHRRHSDDAGSAEGSGGGEHRRR